LTRSGATGTPGTRGGSTGSLPTPPPHPRPNLGGCFFYMGSRTSDFLPPARLEGVLLYPGFERSRSNRPKDAVTQFPVSALSDGPPRAHVRRIQGQNNGALHTGRRQARGGGGVWVVLGPVIVYPRLRGRLRPCTESSRLVQARGGCLQQFRSRDRNEFLLITAAADICDRADRDSAPRVNRNETPTNDPTENRTNKTASERSRADGNGSRVIALSDG